MGRPVAGDGARLVLRARRRRGRRDELVEPDLRRAEMRLARRAAHAARFSRRESARRREPDRTETMDGANSTCWTVIRAAAHADAAPEREEFARRYAAPIRAYLAARWRGRPSLQEEVDDATQEVFVECFRKGGALAKADEERAGGFRAFLYGVVRHVALRCESARPRAAPLAESAVLDALPADEPTLSRAFDRAWAHGLVRAAARRMGEEAAHGDAAARRRVELLRRRFADGAPIRDLAR